MNYLDKFSLKTRTAFVNGGAGLLGSEVVKALSDAGAKVVILYINEKAALKLQKKITSAVFEFFDATNLKELDKKIEELSKKYKKIDIWVNTSFPRTVDWGEKIEKLPLESFEKNVDTPHRQRQSCFCRCAFASPCPPS